MSMLSTYQTHSIVVARPNSRGLEITTFDTMEDLADAAVSRLARGQSYDTGIAYLDRKIRDFTDLRDKLKRERTNEKRNDRRAAKKEKA